MTDASENDNELRQRLYAERRAELLQRQFSNCEAYDQAVLTLSSGLLGLSLAFVTDIVPLSSAVGKGWLYASWAALAAAVISTVISFRVSDGAIQHELRMAERYYLLRDETAYGRSSRAALIARINNLAGAFFVAGILLTIAFVVLNT